MKSKNLLCLAVIALAVSCTVIRDHPKQLPPDSQGPYLLVIKILNDEAVINYVHSACTEISSYDLWRNVEETGNYVIVHLQFNNIGTGSLNRLLENLHSIKGYGLLKSNRSFLINQE